MICVLHIKHGRFLFILLKYRKGYRKTKENKRETINECFTPTSWKRMLNVVMKIADHSPPDANFQ